MQFIILLCYKQYSHFSEINRYKGNKHKYLSINELLLLYLKNKCIETAFFLCNIATRLEITICSYCE